MASWQKIIDEITSVIDGLTSVQEVHDFDKSHFRGFPAVVVVPSENDSDFQATRERERVFAFSTRVFLEMTSDAQSGEGLDETDRIMRAVVDDIVNEFDKPANARLSGNANTTASTVLFIEPVPSQWGWDSARGLRFAEIILRVHVYTDTNQL